MPIEVSAVTSEIVGLDEFRKRVLDKVDPQDPSTLTSIALDLAALANDKELMVRQVAMDIKTWQRPEFAMYSAQSCILDRFGPFTVRANLWPSVAMTMGERDALSYNAFHDHNFSFATTNLYGPGYTTDLYEFQLLGDWARVGDTVLLEHLGERRLSEGIVVVYRKGLDMHSQIPPISPSASINLIVNDDDVLFNDQFYFDPVRRIIIGTVENVVEKRLSALSLGRFLASEASLSPLHAISRTNKCKRSRRLCKDLLA